MSYIYTHTLIHTYNTAKPSMHRANKQLKTFLFLLSSDANFLTYMGDKDTNSVAQVQTVFLSLFVYSRDENLAWLRCTYKRFTIICRFKVLQTRSIGPHVSNI